MPDFKELPHQSLSLLISSQPFMCFWYYAQCQFNIALALLVPGTGTGISLTWGNERSSSSNSRMIIASSSSSSSRIMVTSSSSSSIRDHMMDSKRISKLLSGNHYRDKDQWPYRSAAQITKVECLCSLGQVCFGILWMFVIYNTSCNCYYRNKCAFENAGIMIKIIFNVYYVCLSDSFRRHIMAQFTSVCLSIGLFLTLMLPNLRSEMLPINL